MKDFTPETRSLIDALKAAGFTIVKADNGQDVVYATEGIDLIVATLNSVDESHLYIQTCDGQMLWLYLVYGNNPGELVCDYVLNPELDKVVEAHAAQWAGRPQPMK